jgi:hypothetical protein
MLKDRQKSEFDGFIDCIIIESLHNPMGLFIDKACPRAIGFVHQSGGLAIGMLSMLAA